jgi:hypothetical protein
MKNDSLRLLFLASARAGTSIQLAAALTIVFNPRPVLFRAAGSAFTPTVFLEIQILPRERMALRTVRFFSLEPATPIDIELRGNGL